MRHNAICPICVIRVRKSHFLTALQSQNEG